MCFSQSNPAADIARQQQRQIEKREEERQGKIKEGQGKIDTAFAQFDQPYFDNYRQTYIGNYNPQIADQYSQARDKLTAQLAGRGTLNSSVGAQAFADLFKTKADAESNVANTASDAANSLKSNIQNTKSNLYNLNLSAADPQQIGAQAQAQSAAIVAPQAYPQLGNVFAATLQPFAMANRADATSMRPQLPWNQFGASPLFGRGSAIYG